MSYIIIGLTAFGLGFIAGTVYVYVFGEKTAEARSQGTNPEEGNTDRASADHNNTKEN